MAGFVQSLRATWRAFLLRFALAFVVLAVAWSVVAPAYAHLLTALSTPLIPLIENNTDTRYWVEGATIWTTRSFFDPATQRPLTFKVEGWKGYASYDLILLIALILATPGWPLRMRAKLLALGLVLITLTEFAFFLSTVKYSQLRPVQGQTGSMLFPAGFTRPKQIVFTWVYYFFQTMGRGLFPLLIYWAMVGLTWGTPDKGTPSRAPVTISSRNAPCPCGSGKRYKRCCGRA